MDEEGALALPQVLSVKESEARRGNRRIEEIVADLYAKLRPPLVGYVYHIVGSAADAEDLVQVVFMKLFDELTRRAEIRTCEAGFIALLTTWRLIICANPAPGQSSVWSRLLIVRRRGVPAKTR